ncbi:unnamed protein product [Scytosiphon promiscuus]
MRTIICLAGLLCVVIIVGRAAGAPDDPGLLVLEASTGPRTTSTRLRARGLHSSEDEEKLMLQQKAMAWTLNEEELGAFDGTTTAFSVVVVESKHHTSNLFRDEQRVRALAKKVGGVGEDYVVASVQFTTPRPRTSWTPEGSDPPFYAAHPDGVHRKVMVVHILDFASEGHALHHQQVSHLQAVCDDESVTTVLVVSDETCRRHGLPAGVPDSCLPNVIRIFPYNTVVSPDGGPRDAYMPLGPRDTFDYIPPENLRWASARPLLFNLQVRPDTSDRRVELIEIANRYQESNPDVNCATNRETLHAQEWQELLLMSKFTLSPSGRNPETFRTWEALEAGSIPIVSKLDFTHPTTGPMIFHDCGIGEVAWNTVADSPFAKEVSVENWGELPALLDRLKEAPPGYIDKLQEDTLAWYTSTMQKTYWSVLDFGKGHDFYPQKGPVGFDG